MDNFDKFAALMRSALSKAMAWGDGHLYRTNKVQLDKHYLDGFYIPSDRQYHNCSACLSFLRRYGGLAVISKDGKEVRSAMFFDLLPEQVPDHFRRSFIHMVEHFYSQLRVRSIFESSLSRWGTPEAGGWRHFWADNPRVYKRTTLSAGQKMAQHEQNFATLQRALNEIPQATFVQVAQLMQSSKEIKHADKFRHLAELYASLAPIKDNVRLWHAVATGPDGFTSVKSSALGVLYDDLMKGMQTSAAIARFNALTDARVYQQPTAPAKAGNIDRAEKIFADLGLALALERREVPFDEIVGRCAWKPDQAQQLSAPAPRTGIFATLHDEVVPIDGGRIELSLRRFMEKVCLNLTRMRLDGLDKPHDMGFLTGPVHADAPTLFRWDNSFGWVRFYGVRHGDFGVGPNEPVIGVLDLPSTWTTPHGVPRGLMFLVANATNNLASTIGSGIPAEGLRSDLREVQRTIVMHSRKGTLLRASGTRAAGLIVREDDFKPFTVVGMHGTGVTCAYHITSWE